MSVSLKDRHLAVACVLAVLTASGCYPRVDLPAFEAKLRKEDPEIREFLDAFPNADVSLRTFGSRGNVYPDPRQQIVSVRNELADGYAVGMGRTEVHIEPDGLTYHAHNPWQHYLEFPKGGRIALPPRGFDSLLAARGDLASLKPFDIDFSLPPMDEEKVIDGVRKLSPLAVEFHEAFPNSVTSVFKEPYRQLGRLYSSVRLADEVRLSVEHRIRVAADGFSVELVSGDTVATPEWRKVLDVPTDWGLDLDLTSDQFDRILAAKGAPHVVRRIWSERPRPKHQGDDIYEVPNEG